MIESNPLIFKACQQREEQVDRDARAPGWSFGDTNPRATRLHAAAVLVLLLSR